MSIDKSTVQRVAQLAKLAVPEAESERLANELSTILSLVEQMNTVDTTAIEPLTHPADAQLRLRPDVVSASDRREPLQALAPDTEVGLYKVPKVIE